jgi:hypothetical protein
MRAAQCSAAAGLADVGASDSGGGGKNFLRRGSAWRPDELEPGYATPFRGRERGKMRLLHGRPVREEGKIKKSESSKKGARGWRSQRFRQPDAGNGALPSRRLKLSQGDARGIDFVIASTESSGSAVCSGT